MKGRQKLKTLCETCWASRSEVLYTFKAAFSTAHATLGDLSTDPKGAFLVAIERFDFIVTLWQLEHALSGLVSLSNLLQKYTAVEESHVVTRQLNGPEVRNALYDSAVELAVLTSMQRNRAGQQNRPYVPAENPSAHRKLNIYLLFVDHLITESDTRLLTAKPWYKAQYMYLLPKKATDLTQILVDEIYDCHRIRRWRGK